VLLAASCGSTAIHRSVYEAARHGPAQAVEFALALLTFLLASTGILLLIQGASLFARTKGGDHTAGLTQIPALRASLKERVTPAGHAFDTRRGASMEQARHTIAACRRLKADLALGALRPCRTSQGRAAQPRR
jgi:hypothetical protein